MEKETKLRALCILKILYELTDATHQLSTAEIAELLEEKYGLKVYRITIKSDIEQLRQFGIDICINKSTQNRYFMAGRLFDVPELKLLIDAVESYKLISEKKSKELVEKLGTLAAKNSSADLKRNICIEGRAYPVNEQIYSIIDTLNDAVNRGKKVSFRYFRYNVKKEKKLCNDGEAYVISPYTLVWNGDYCCVVGYFDKHQAIESFRVDRIYKQPKILKENADLRPESFDEAEYVKAAFRVCSKKPEAVELICDNDIMDAVIDKFGEDVTTYAYSLSSFKAEVEVAASRLFYSWVFGLGGKVKIKGPENVRLEYAEMVKAAAADCADVNARLI